MEKGNGIGQAIGKMIMDSIQEKQAENTPELHLKGELIRFSNNKRKLLDNQEALTTALTLVGAQNTEQAETLNEEISNLEVSLMKKEARIEALEEQLEGSVSKKDLEEAVDCKIHEMEEEHEQEKKQIHKAQTEELARVKADSAELNDSFRSLLREIRQDVDSGANWQTIKKGIEATLAKGGF